MKYKFTESICRERTRKVKYIYNIHNIEYTISSLRSNVLVLNLCRNLHTSVACLLCLFQVLKTVQVPTMLPLSCISIKNHCYGVFELKTFDNIRTAKIEWNSYTVVCQRSVHIQTRKLFSNTCWSFEMNRTSKRNDNVRNIEDTFYTRPPGREKNRKRFRKTCKNNLKHQRFAANAKIQLIDSKLYLFESRLPSWFWTHILNYIRNAMFNPCKCFLFHKKNAKTSLHST